MADRALTPLYARVNEAPRVFGVGRDTVYRPARAGRLTIHKMGAASLIRVAEMEALIEASEKSLGD